MISAVDRRSVAAVVAAGAVFLLGCFAVGVFAVRSTTEGLMVIYALGCLIVYLTKPQRMVWIALFLAFASLPPLNRAKHIGPVWIYDYHVAILLAIVCLIPLARLRFSAYVLPGTFLLTVAFFAAAGVEAGRDPEQVAREASILCGMVAGFLLALLIVRTNYVRESIRVVAAVLWFSAGMILASSLTGLRLAGRVESLQGTTGSGEAIRLLTATQAPVLAVLAALVAAQILGRGRSSVHLALGAPALVITLLSFPRSILIVLAVAAVVAFVASLGWSAVRRSAVMVAVVAASVAVVVPVTLFLLQNSAAGAWLADQVNAFSHRVIGGVSATALSVDSSALDRLHENAHLERAISDAPLYGHGLGYAYQLPFGKPGTFTATLGTTYAHNFYLWWLVKAGAIGMASFAVFALTPVVRGIRSASVEAKISAAVSAALLAVSVVDPLPLESASSLVLGMALGAAMGFARPPQRAEQVAPSDSIADPVAHTRSRSHSCSNVIGSIGSRTGRSSIDGGGPMAGSEEIHTTTQGRTVSKFYRQSPGLAWLLALLLVSPLLGVIGYSARDRSDKDIDVTLPSVNPSAALTITTVTGPNVNVPAMSFAPLSISRNGNDFNLSGDLPDAAAKASLLDALKGALGGDVNLIDNVNIQAGVNAPHFPGIGAVFKAGAAIPDFNFNLDGETITLTGTASSEDEKAAVEAAARAAWPNLKISNDIGVEAPTGAPGTAIPAPAPGPTAECTNLQADINGPLRTPINFDTDGFTLTPVTEQMLTQVADKLKACPESRVAVNGYTDNTGNNAINVPLSGDRAKSVADFLVSQGVAGDGVTPNGLGSANPIASNDTPDGRAQNRRVEITVS